MPAGGIRGQQIKDDSLTGDDIDESTLVLPFITDADGDTTVHCEESGDEDFIRFDTAGAERMVITNAGLVGIGTDNPDNTLHVKSSGDTHIKIESDVGSYPALKMKSGTAGSTYVWTPADTSDLRLYAGGADRMHIDNLGNVGIATTGPDRKLDILDSTNPQLRLTHTNATHYADFKATDAGDLWIKPSNINGHVKFISDENASIVIQSGDVGDSDAIISFSVDGGASIPWSMGCDDSDFDKFKIGTITPDVDSKLTIDSIGTTLSGSLGVRGVSWFAGAASLNTGQRMEFLADAGAPGLIEYRNGAFWGRSAANNNAANTVLEATSVVGDMLGPALHTTHMYHYGVNGTPASNAGNVRRYTDNSSANNFTGQHNVLPAEGTGIVENLAEYVGLIVRSTGEYCRFDEPSLSWVSGSSSITIAEALPRVALTTTANDKSAFGVISNMPNEYLVSTENGEYEQDQDGIAKGFGNIYQEQVRINSIGEGAIWVVNTSGNLENGDYITTSALPGYGMKQTDDLLHNYTVAKTTQNCNFDLNSSAYKCEELEFGGEIYRKAFVGCTYHCG